MSLKPSEIRFSQDSIKDRFDWHSPHRRKKIGETLDDICEERCSIHSIPRITVVNENDRWITADNRRLWVFQHLERLGKCVTIPIKEALSIPFSKRTSKNDGASVRVRGDPGGRWYFKPTVFIIPTATNSGISKPVLPSTLAVESEHAKLSVFSTLANKSESNKPAIFLSSANKSDCSQPTVLSLTATKSEYPKQAVFSTLVHKLANDKSTVVSPTATKSESTEPNQNTIVDRRTTFERQEFRRPHYSERTLSGQCTEQPLQPKSSSSLRTLHKGTPYDGDTVQSSTTRNSNVDCNRPHTTKRPNNTFWTVKHSKPAYSPPEEKFRCNYNRLPKDIDSVNAEEMTARPIVAHTVKDRIQVAAIDFGTTYSGYAYSFLSDFLADPLSHIHTNKWTTGSNLKGSLKTATCILFTPQQEFHSFGFLAEDKYAELTIDGHHDDWFYFKHFKMVLYENDNLNRNTMLTADNKKEMAATTVFSESIRYLKDHMISHCSDRQYGLHEREIHWILTVPAIWDDSAKQFMREAAINAGINTNSLSLALEPEAASLFCKYIPTTKMANAEGTGVRCFKPGTRYLVLDAGGGTIDITVHETLGDGTVKEIYKANGGPWGGTTIDKAFHAFLEEILEEDTMLEFIKNHKDDYLDLCRDFEVKKTIIGPDTDQKVTFTIPLSVHECYRRIKGQDFRNNRLKDQFTLLGNKLRVQATKIQALFTRTCDQIVFHLTDIFTKPAVRGTDTILMVGGFSESKMLQAAVKNNFPRKTVIVPIEPGLAVLKGAVLFGHNPSAIVARVARYTYGIGMCRPFIPGVHPLKKRMVIDGRAKCVQCFDKHIEEGQVIEAGQTFAEHLYVPASRESKAVSFKVYRSQQTDPQFVDDIGCTRRGHLDVDVSNIAEYKDREILVTMVYNGTELGVQAKVRKTGEMLKANIELLDLTFK